MPALVRAGSASAFSESGGGQAFKVHFQIALSMSRSDSSRPPCAAKNHILGRSAGKGGVPPGRKPTREETHLADPGSGNPLLTGTFPRRKSGRKFASDTPPSIIGLNPRKGRGPNLTLVHYWLKPKGAKEGGGNPASS